MADKAQVRCRSTCPTRACSLVTPTDTTCRNTCRLPTLLRHLPQILTTRNRSKDEYISTITASMILTLEDGNRPQRPKSYKSLVGGVLEEVVKEASPP